MVLFSRVEQDVKGRTKNFSPSVACSFILHTVELELLELKWRVPNRLFRDSELC